MVSVAGGVVLLLVPLTGSNNHFKTNRRTWKCHQQQLPTTHTPYYKDDDDDEEDDNQCYESDSNTRWLKEKLVLKRVQNKKSGGTPQNE